MKKILRASSWNTDAMTAENFQSNWFYKFLDAALTALDIGTYSIEFSMHALLLTTANFGSTYIHQPAPGYVNETDFIAYVDSENKELLMCASYDQVVQDDVTVIDSNITAGFIRGPIRVSPKAIAKISVNGGIFAFKFENGTIFAEMISSGSNSIVDGFTNNCCGCPLPTNNKCLATPITATKVKISKKPIIIYTGPTSPRDYKFEGKYFESIYICDKYFLGSMRSSDNKYFYYNGYVFAVDDARDIETVITTV